MSKNQQRMVSAYAAGRQAGVHQKRLETGTKGPTFTAVPKNMNPYFRNKNVWLAGWMSGYNGEKKRSVIWRR